MREHCLACIALFGILSFFKHLCAFRTEPCIVQVKWSHCILQAASDYTAAKCVCKTWFKNAREEASTLTAGALDNETLCLSVPRFNMVRLSPFAYLASRHNLSHCRTFC
jgi:hypothetical protein